MVVYNPYKFCIDPIWENSVMLKQRPQLLQIQILHPVTEHNGMGIPHGHTVQTA